MNQLHSWRARLSERGHTLALSIWGGRTDVDRGSNRNRVKGESGRRNSHYAGTVSLPKMVHGHGMGRNRKTDRQRGGQTHLQLLHTILSRVSCNARRGRKWDRNRKNTERNCNRMPRHSNDGRHHKRACSVDR
eukprot:748690-Rhodomonas_salina.2